MKIEQYDATEWQLEAYFRLNLKICEAKKSDCLWGEFYLQKSKYYNQGTRP